MHATIARSDMELIGREEHIRRLDNYIHGGLGGNLVIHGQRGQGKTFLMRSWLIDFVDSDEQVIKIYIAVRSELQPAQCFLKQFVTELQAQLPPELIDQWQQDLSESSRFPSSISAWADQLSSRYQVDGYIFLLKLKSLLKIFPGKILFCLDQAERLSAEGRELLRLICEWKPERLFVVFSICTQEAGKKGIEADFGIQFFFKGNQYIHLERISPFLEDSYRSLYGIDADLQYKDLMSSATQQKKLWLEQYCKNNSDLLEILAFLVCFSEGIPHIRNPHFESMQALIAKQPLLRHIIDVGANSAVIHDSSLLDGLRTEYSELFGSIAQESLTLGRDFMKPHNLLELEIMVAGAPSEESVLALLTHYETSRSLNLLLELCEAMIDIPWSNSLLKNHLEWNLKIIDLLLRFDRNKASNMITNLPAELSIQWEMLIEVLWQFGAEDLWLDHLKVVGTTQKLSSLVMQVLLKKSIREDLEALQIQKLTADYGEDALLVHLVSLLQFIEGQEKPDNWDEIMVALPEMAHYAEAGFYLENDKVLLSLEHLQTAIGISLNNGNLSYLPMLLTLLSECYSSIGDFDHQLFFYREAVIAQQFLSNGV